jgi:hypothetical protein
MNSSTRGTASHGLGGACLALALMVWLSSGAVAQTPDSGLAAIRGTVYDSLLHSPLAGARVWLVRSPLVTETDAHGGYAFDSVPAGRQVIAFSRSDLDSIGLSDFATAVTLAPGQVAVVPLAVPSHATFWGAACGALPARLDADTGLVFGTVRDAETGRRLAGAVVTLTWPTVRRERSHTWVIEYQAKTETTDSLGSYYACRIPVEYLLGAQTRAGSFASGTVDVLVDSRGVVRRDLTLSLEDVAGGRDSAGVQRRGLATLIGTARGERGGVLPGSYASLESAGDTVPADDQGRFVLRGLPSGTQMLLVRRVGYFAARQVVDLRNRDTAWADVAMAEATVLDTIRVTASPVLLPVLREIDERRMAGFGYFLAGREVQRRTSMRSVFEGFPSLDVQGGAHNFTLVMRNVGSVLGGTQCRPDVYIDRFPADVEQLASMLPSELLAVEIYPRLGPGLLHYLRFDTCAVVLVWTKWAQ